MNYLLSIYKPQGMTPFQMVQKLRKQRPELADVKIGYAGRLDPLAHGVLLLMVGEATKERDQYIGLEKSYEFIVLFGLQTDTYDYLGMFPKVPRVPQVPRVSRVFLEEFVKNKLGNQTLPYPPFSSKTIDGVPLFQLSKDGKLEGKEMPSRKVTIREFTCLAVDTISSQDLKGTILSNIVKVEGDFRQEEITKQWADFFVKYPEETFTTARFSLTCSSGTYVRSLVNMMGEKFGCGAIALEILRTKVGQYTLKDSLKM